MLMIAFHSFVEVAFTPEEVYSFLKRKVLLVKSTFIYDTLSENYFNLQGRRKHTEDKIHV